MTSLSPHLELNVGWADAELLELTVSAASERFSGAVELYASPDELRDIAERLTPFLDSRSERREFVLGQEDFAGHGTLRLSLYRKIPADTVMVEAVLRVNPTERVGQPPSCVVHLSVGFASLERFQVELRNMAQRLTTRTGLGARR